MSAIIYEINDCTTGQFIRWHFQQGAAGCYGQTYTLSDQDYQTLLTTGTWPGDPHAITPPTASTIDWVFVGISALAIIGITYFSTKHRHGG